MGNYAGVDWASEKHDVLIANEAGEELLAATFAHEENGLRALCRMRVRLKVELVAIERPDGVLVERLLDAGLRVIALRPNQAAATRSRLCASGGKSDRFDAFVLCELARTDHHRFRVLEPDSDQTKALRALTRAREDLVRSRVALSNQLRGELERFWPGPIGMFAQIRELRAAASDYEPEPLLLGEVGVADPERWAAYYGDGDELMLALNFGFWSQPWSAAAFHDVIATTSRLVPDGAWPVWPLGNHDIMRLATRYDQDGRGPLRARVAAMMLLTLRGTPLLYYGDEIGMTNVAVPAGDAVDIDGRDGARTPMQWSAGPNAGFTTASTPWLPVPDARVKNDNVTDQQADPESLWSLYHDLLTLRRSTPALPGGESLLLPTPTDTSSPTVVLPPGSASSSPSTSTTTRTQFRYPATSQAGKSSSAPIRAGSTASAAMLSSSPRTKV